MTNQLQWPVNLKIGNDSFYPVALNDDVEMIFPLIMGPYLNSRANCKNIQASR